MFKNPGTKWPIIIAVSIIGIIGACIWTIKVALNNPVQLSDYGMQGYHDYDANVNEIIKAKIAFDQKYTIALVTPQISEKGTVIEYSVTDKTGNAVDNASVEVVLTRPNETQHNMSLTSPTVLSGKYTFAPVDLPLAGRWDILAKVSVGEDQRYYNLKADTRKAEMAEF
jgi:hypothetical protein